MIKVHADFIVQHKANKNTKTPTLQTSFLFKLCSKIKQGKNSGYSVFYLPSQKSNTQLIHPHLGALKPATYSLEELVFGHEPPKCAINPTP
jgi:hypothetical protein